MYISKLVLNKNVKQSIYRLRYQIYNIEMARNVDTANHENNLLIDSLDQSGHLFACYQDSTLIGTALGNTAADDNLGMYNELYQLSSLNDDERKKTYIVTKLMFEKEARKKLGVSQLLSYMYLYYLEHGFKSCIIDCNEHLVAFFKKLGFQQIGTSEHPDFGKVALMKLDVVDFDWLEAVKSPFRHMF